MSWERIKAEIEAVPVLTLEEERALGQAIKEGHHGAKKELIAANLRHAIPIALALSKHGHRWEPGDLLGEAVRAMDAACERWDGRVPFGAYVVRRIRGSMRDFLRRRADSIRAPEGTKAAMLSLDHHQEDEPDMHERGVKTAAGYETGETVEGPALPDTLTSRERKILTATVLRTPPGTIPQAAAELGLKEQTVRTDLRRALRKCAAPSGE